MAQTSSMQYFLAVTLWVAAWWVVDIVNGDPIGLFLAVLFAIVGWGMALGAIRTAVPARSPFTSPAASAAAGFCEGADSYSTAPDPSG